MTWIIVTVLAIVVTCIVLLIGGLDPKNSVFGRKCASYDRPEKDELPHFPYSVEPPAEGYSPTSALDTSDPPRVDHEKAFDRMGDAYAELVNSSSEVSMYLALLEIDYPDEHILKICYEGDKEKIAKCIFLFLTEEPDIRRMLFQLQTMPDLKV